MGHSPQNSMHTSLALSSLLQMEMELFRYSQLSIVLLHPTVDLKWNKIVSLLPTQQINKIYIYRRSSFIKCNGVLIVTKTSLHMVSYEHCITSKWKVSTYLMAGRHQVGTLAKKWISILLRKTKRKHNNKKYVKR